MVKSGQIQTLLQNYANNTTYLRKWVYVPELPAVIRPKLLANCWPWFQTIVYIAALQEGMLSSSSNLRTPYRLFRKERDPNNNGGGIALLVHYSIQYSTKNLTYRTASDHYLFRTIMVDFNAHIKGNPVDHQTPLSLNMRNSLTCRIRLVV